MFCPARQMGAGLDTKAEQEKHKHVETWGTNRQINIQNDRPPGHRPNKAGPFTVLWVELESISERILHIEDSHGFVVFLILPMAMVTTFLSLLFGCPWIRCATYRTGAPYGEGIRRTIVHIPHDGSGGGFQIALTSLLLRRVSLFLIEVLQRRGNQCSSARHILHQIPHHRGILSETRHRLRQRLQKFHRLDRSGHFFHRDS